MASGVSSTCTVHVGFEAVGRCKQCGKPFCSQCQVRGATGLFCCADCKESHEAFTARAQQIDSMRKDSTTFEKLWLTFKKIVMIALFVIIVVTVLHFAGIEVPVASNLIRSIMDS